MLLQDFPAEPGLSVQDRAITFNLRSWDGQDFGMGGSSVVWIAPVDRVLPAGTLIQINPNQELAGQPGTYGWANIGSVDRNAPLPYEGGWDMQWGEVLYANAGYSLWNPNSWTPTIRTGAATS